MPTVPTTTPTVSPTSTPTTPPWQNYKPTGTLTPWEAKVGGQVAYNAHLLLAQADQFYFWSNSDPGENTNPPKPLDYDINLPISLDPARYKRPLVPLADLYKYTKGRIPFVCGDVPDLTYFMTGYNLQVVIDSKLAEGFIPQSEAYPDNRWPRSAYGYERMLQLIRLGGIGGKSEIWNVQTNGDNYLFTKENVPEIGDIVVTKKSGDLQSPNAEHVVVVAEVHGLHPDEIMIIEGNPDDGTIVMHSLEELKDGIPGLMYILYGHPNLP